MHNTQLDLARVRIEQLVGETFNLKGDIEAMKIERGQLLRTLHELTYPKDERSRFMALNKAKELLSFYK